MRLEREGWMTCRDGSGEREYGIELLSASRGRQEGG